MLIINYKFEFENYRKFEITMIIIYDYNPQWAYIYRLTQIMDLCNGVFRNKNGSATGLCGFPRTAPAAKSRPESAPLSSNLSKFYRTVI